MHTQLEQSPPLTWPNLDLFGPDKLGWPHPDDSLRPHIQHEGVRTTSGWQLDLVYVETFSGWPQIQHWH